MEVRSPVYVLTITLAIALLICIDTHAQVPLDPEFPFTQVWESGDIGYISSVKVNNVGDDGTDEIIASATDGIGSVGAISLDFAWEKYAGNPVLGPGLDGTWDDEGLLYPTVLFDSVIYRMWYTGHDGAETRIGYATSADGMTWQKYPNNPVLDIGVSGEWDDYRIVAPCVIFDGSQYKMWYGARAASSQIWRIGYATSTDGIMWEKYAGNPVVDVGALGDWDFNFANSPNVIFDGVSYKMWYHGLGGVRQIGYATSADGIEWIKYSGNPVLGPGSSGEWDDYQIGKPTVIFDGANYIMWYSGHTYGRSWRIGYATSADGVTWEKYADNPVLGTGEDGEWDAHFVEAPTALLDVINYRMWYTGNDGSTYRIGYAASPVPQAELQITIEDLPNSSVGELYMQTLQSTGGIPPYTWNIIAGSLPNGLSINEATGEISGTPIVDSTFSFTVRVTDSEGRTTTKALFITIENSVDASLPRFLTLPLTSQARIVNGWHYSYPANPIGILHNGIDYEATYDQVVVAAADGIAMTSSQYASGSGYGRFVLIRHNETDPSTGLNYFTLYAHINRAAPDIKEYSQDERRNTNYDEWTSVQRGQLIGYVGHEDTSWVHLHFEVSKGGYAQNKTDPYDLYKKTTTEHNSADYYPSYGTLYKSCGPEHLWTQDPPKTADAIEVPTPDTKDTGDYKMVSLNPDPNSSEPAVMSGGICYLYYRIADADDKPVMDVTVGFTVNGTSYTSPPTREDGMLIIPVEAINSQPGGVLSVSITRLGATAVDEPVMEQVLVTTREYEQIWELGSAVSGKVGAAVGANGYIKAQTEDGISYALDELDALVVTRSAETGVGGGVGVKTPGAKLTLGAVKAKAIAEAGVEAIIYSIFADEYQFADRHEREQQMAQSALLVDTIRRISGTPSPLSTWLVEALIEQVGGSYTEYRSEESVALGTRLSAGASVSAGAKLGTFTSKTGQSSSLAGLSIEGSAEVALGIGGEHTKYYEDGVRDATGFALNQELGAEVQIGALLGSGTIPGESYRADDASAKVGVEFTGDYVSASAGVDYGKSGFAGIFYKFGVADLLEFREEYIMKLDGTPREFSLSIGDSVRTITFTIQGEDISKVGQSVANLAAFIDVANDIDVKVGEQAIADELGKLFEQLGTMEIDYVVKEGPVSSFSFPLSLEGNLGLDVGVSYEIEASKSLEHAILEGVFLGGKLYPRYSYTDEPESTVELASIADDALQGSWEIVKELFNQVAESIIEGTQAIIETVAETVEKGAEVVKGTARFVGTFTRDLKVNVVSWFVPAEERPAPAPAKAMTAYQQAEARAMFPVVGGYYQFTPEGEPLAEPGELTITYTDEEVAGLGISEGSLRISYWAPEESRWVSVGGTIDAANNSVTATITALHLYAITFDSTPPHIGQLSPAPGSIISDPLNPITASIVDDTDQVDFSSITMLLDDMEVVYSSQGESIVHIPVGLSPGEHVVTVKASDLFGNAAEQTWSFILRDPEAPAWDLNSDGITDLSDLMAIAGVFGQAGEDLEEDLNSDGVVDIMDLMIVASHFGETTNLTAPISPQMASSAHVDMVEDWLKQAKMADDGSELFHRGISILERLLSQIVPQKTALMQNYPNPFNPDTWIPYQLNEGADVSIIIYDATGRIVRSLDMGHRDAGVYRTRDRAVHWDGRNEAGEMVASGAYFVLLKAGQHQQVKRIVLIR